MNCPSLEELFAYRRGELDAAAEESVEAHYFGCDLCAERITWLGQLGEGVVAALRHGLYAVAVTRQSVERLERAGAVLRKYHLAPGEHTNCTAGPDDELTVLTLRAPPRPEPVTLITEMIDRASGARTHEEQTVFQDQRTGEVIVGLPGERQRKLGYLHVTMTLRYEDGETAGPYNLDHSPWPKS